MTEGGRLPRPGKPAPAPAVDPLPIDPFLPDITEALRDHRALVVTAPPGAGKTTRIPPAILRAGLVREGQRLVVLQPRRVAARSIARRIAAEQGLGDGVGWHVRFERRFGPRTRIILATEGILTAALEDDPLLAGTDVVVLDEFHERSLHADLALARCREILEARDEFRLVVMSATLNARAVAAWLGNAPVIEAPGRPWPVAIRWRPELDAAAAVREVLRETPEGHVLVFLPGAGEIRRAALDLAGADADVLPLHGDMDVAEQDQAFAPGRRRKVILATNIAETSVTIEGVKAVIDTGLHRVARFDPWRGIDRLVLERIPADSAAQRAGRAGRTGPGTALRLWPESERLEAEREPEIRRVDLASTLLGLLVQGIDPRRFAWFEAPPEAAVAAALAELRELDLIDDGCRPTGPGRAVSRLPLPPRLAVVLREAHRLGVPDAGAAAAAVLSERDFLRARREDVTASSDILLRIERIGEAPPGIRRIRDHLRDLAIRSLGPAPAGAGGEEAVLRALLAGYRDRVARRREPGSDRLVLSSGRGAVLSPASAVRAAEYLLAIELRGDDRPSGRDPRVELASAVDPAWLTPRTTTRELRYDAMRDAVREVAVERFRSLVLAERAVPLSDPDEASARLAEEARSRDPESLLTEEARRLLCRWRFALTILPDLPRPDLAASIGEAARGVHRMVDLVERLGGTLSASLSFAERRALDAAAPERLVVPSGRAVPIRWEEGAPPTLSVKLQEMFGLLDTPRIGGGRVALVIELLSPAGRPVQVTGDLRSFWERTYPVVRKELRARYPRHPWPEDPGAAEPTARTKPRHGGGRAN